MCIFLCWLQQDFCWIQSKCKHKLHRILKTTLTTTTYSPNLENLRNRLKSKSRCERILHFVTFWSKPFFRTFFLRWIKCGWILVGQKTHILFSSRERATSCKTEVLVVFLYCNLWEPGTWHLWECNFRFLCLKLICAFSVLWADRRVLIKIATEFNYSQN